METHLNIEHLAPYLPYELGLQWIDLNIVTMSDTNIMLAISKNIKPILSPLSDLKNNIGGDKNSVTYAAYLKLWVAADVDFVINMPLSCDYSTVQKMLEWHFDVFGLIEKGLAIDINTI